MDGAGGVGGLLMVVRHASPNTKSPAKRSAHAGVKSNVLSISKRFLNLQAEDLRLWA